MTFSCKGQTQNTYTALLDHIIHTRDQLHLRYLAADSTERTVVLPNARTFLTQSMTRDLLPAWYGTPWDFNGTTRTPKKGQIACGYFVTNTLTDLGFDLPRVQWAQSASEVFIKKLAFGRVKRFYGQPISKIAQFLKQAGDGLYLVGLDNHTGFVWVNGQQLQFIHADYYNPQNGVTAQLLTAQSPLTDSRYRVFGQLFSDEMLVHWLEKTALQ